MNKTALKQKVNMQKRDFIRRNSGEKRDLLDTAIRYSQLPGALLITGVRRVGKTTLMKQLHDHLVAKGVTQQQITFFSFDEHRTRNLKFLSQLLEFILPTPNNIDDPNYIFLDEIQYIKNWQGTLKRYIDSYPQTKFILSGSASLFIKNKSNESLAGRTWELYLPPLNFHESQHIRYGQSTPPSIDIKSFLTNPQPEVFDAIQENWSTQQADRDISTRFLEYILFGQFPEACKLPSYEDRYTYINNGIYQKLVQEDLPYIFDIANVAEFTQLYEILIQETANYLTLGNLAREFHISVNTLKRYLYILEEGFLLKIMPAFKKSLRKRTRTMQKQFIISSNFYAAQNHLMPAFGDKSVLGHLLETVLHGKLRSLFKNLFFYYHQRKEIDFLVTDDPRLNRLIPIEVKYKHNIQAKDYKLVLSYMSQHNINNGFLLSMTTDKFESGDKTIWTLPAPLFT